jgi:hypothetical protein
MMTTITILTRDPILTKLFSILFLIIYISRIEMENSKEKVDDKIIQLDEIKITGDNKKIKVGPYKEKKISSGDDEYGFSNINNRDNIPHPDENSIDHDLRTVEKFKVPSNLKKTFIFTMVLAAVGLILIILGCINQVAQADPGRGITFWVLGSIVMIPGGYYSYQFWRAKRAETEEDREEILEQIPEL